jgi:hypothetical protein
MKMRKITMKLFAAVVVAVASITSAQAQSNLGADCGCPTPVSSRTTTLLSTLANVGGPTDGDLIATNTILDCTKNWVLDKKIYVPDGKTLTIMPGTVIKGVDTITVPANAAALIVTRGGKLFADGSPTCQIVFTALSDNVDGSYPVSNRGKWGGLVILGKGVTNYTSCNTNYGGSPGTGFVEGFSAANSRDVFGGTDDDDNSGIIRYVSVRHSGAILAIGNELNGISLGAVGKSTIFEHVEVISSDDDGVEVWGGKVNLKYVTTMFGADDGLDWDCGWRGKGQFLFNFQTDSVTAPSADNGIEADADDQKSNATPRSHPVIYNMTAIGSGKRLNVSDNSGHNAINAKELTEGEVYNSVFMNFNSGLNLISSLGTSTCGTRTIETYNNWINGSLVISCNTFGLTNDATNRRYLTIGSSTSGVTPSDTVKFYNDGNIPVFGTSPIAGFNHNLIMNTSNNTVSQKYDVTPNPALSTTCSTPSDGFFVPSNYRGAFASSGKNWMSDWAYAQILNVTSGLVACPTDINGDGITNNVDFLQLLGQFNTSCN